MCPNLCLQNDIDGNSLGESNTMADSTPTYTGHDYVEIDADLPISNDIPIPAEPEFEYSKSGDYISLQLPM